MLAGLLALAGTFVVELEIQLCLAQTAAVSHPDRAAACLVESSSVHDDVATTMQPICVLHTIIGDIKGHLHLLQIPLTCAPSPLLFGQILAAFLLPFSASSLHALVVQTQFVPLDF